MAPSARVGPRGARANIFSPASHPPTATSHNFSAVRRTKRRSVFHAAVSPSRKPFRSATSTLREPRRSISRMTPRPRGVNLPRGTLTYPCLIGDRLKAPGSRLALPLRPRRPPPPLAASPFHGLNGHAAELISSPGTPGTKEDRPDGFCHEQPGRG